MMAKPAFVTVFMPGPTPERVLVVRCALISPGQPDSFAILDIGPQGETCEEEMGIEEAREIFLGRYEAGAENCLDDFSRSWTGPAGSRGGNIVKKEEGKKG